MPVSGMSMASLQQMGFYLFKEMQRSQKDKTSEKSSNATLTNDSRNELIPIINQENVQVVDARQLHAFMQVKSNFAEWINRRIKEYDFELGIDYIRNFEKSLTKPINQYYLTLDMAKELSMIERNEQGRTIRKYFIQKEKELQDIRKIGVNNSQIDIFKGLKGTTINGRKVWLWTAVKVMLGYSTGTHSGGYKYRYPNHFIKVGEVNYITDEMARYLATQRAIRQNRIVIKGMQAVLALDFGMKGGVSCS